jgi:hypothetical protein
VSLFTRITQVPARWWSRTASKVDAFDEILTEEAIASVFPSEETTHLGLESITPRPRLRPTARRSRATSNAVMIACAAVVVALGGFWFRPAAVSTGVLRVESTPPGASARVDDRAAAATPFSLTLPAGAHHIVVGEGSSTRRFDVNVAASTTVVHHVELNGVSAVATTGTAPVSPATGSIDVTTTPAHVQITIDGVTRGFSPARIGGFAPGDHQVVLTMGDTPYRRQVRVEPGTTASLVVGGSASGWLAVPAPAPLQVIENGAIVGTSQSERIMLPAGEHHFDFINEELGLNIARRVTIEPSHLTTVSLEWPTAPVSINASPWADVWIDDVHLGETPIGASSQPLGTHQVIFRHPQFGERRRTLLVTANAAARLSVDMRQP